MNPFTRFLSQWSKNDSLSEFISYWDRLEKVVILVYREKLPAAEAEAEFAVVWSWLRQNYGSWEPALRPYWQRTQAAGEPTKTDPFALLLEIETPQAIAGDWQAMQFLPAAREALNIYLRQHER